MKDFIQLTFVVVRSDLEAVEDALLELGALAVSMVDAGNQPLFDVGAEGRPVWDTLRLRALFASELDLDQLRAGLSAALGEPGEHSWQLELLPGQDWHRAWMDRYQPLCFGERLWVVPSWKKIPERCSHPVTLDPGTAFGTGTHATTALCLEWLDAWSCADQFVIDYGCGSGVLGIAAAILGAKTVAAIDNDPTAVSHCRENAEKNNLGSARFSAHLDTSFQPETQADVVLANILAGPLQQLAPVLCRLLRPGGQLILSGILNGQTTNVIAAYNDIIDFENPRTRDGWVLLQGTRQA